MRQTSGRFEAFCDFVGTAGSFAGCSQAFKEYNPAIACYIVEPPQSAVLSGETVQNPSHEIQGSIVAQADAPKEKQIEIAGPFIAFSKWLQEAYRQPVGAPLSTDELDKLVASAPRGRAQSNLGYFAGSFFYHRHDLEQARRYLAQCQKGGHTGSQRTISLLPATRPAGRRTAEKAGEIATNNSAPGAEAWQIEYGPNRVVANFQ